MKKISLTLLAAGAMAVAGLAQADAVFYPDGTMVELGPNGADNLVLLSEPTLDTTVLGAAPATATVTTTVAPVSQYVYVQPNINWDPVVARAQLRDENHLMMTSPSYRERHQSAATFDVPSRAGEASTMTNGQPNLLTTNEKPLVVGSYSVPLAAVTTTTPYYVFSY
jgi:hypothetical protein